MVGIQTTTNTGGTGIVACGSKTLSTIPPTTTVSPTTTIPATTTVPSKTTVVSSATPGPTQGRLQCYEPGGNDWNGNARKSFPRDTGVFSLEHICGTNGPTYTSDPTSKDNGVTGYAGERFWFESDDKFCMSTHQTYWQDEQTTCQTKIRTLWLNVAFSDDQTGCAKSEKWDIPKTQDCTDIFYQLLDGCDVGTTTYKNGGILTQNTTNGCVDWRLWGVGA